MACRLFLFETSHLFPRTYRALWKRPQFPKMYRRIWCIRCVGALCARLPQRRKKTFGNVPCTRDVCRAPRTADLSKVGSHVPPRSRRAREHAGKILDTTCCLVVQLNISHSCMLIPSHFELVHPAPRPNHFPIRLLSGRTLTHFHSC